MLILNQGKLIMKRILIDKKTLIEPKNPNDSKRLKAYRLRELIEMKEKEDRHKIKDVAEKIVLEQDLKQFKERTNKD